MKKRRIPCSWVVEEKAYGAVELREEIARHKREDTVRWSIWKSIGIRVLYVYAVLVTLVLVATGLLLNWLRSSK